MRLANSSFDKVNKMKERMEWEMFSSGGGDSIFHHEQRRNQNGG